MNSRVSSALSILLLVLYVLSVTVGVFTAGIWAYAGIGGGLIMWITLSLAQKRFIVPEKNITILVLLALVLVAAEIPFSYAPTLSWREGWKLLTIFVPLLGLAVPAATQNLYPRFFPLMFIASITGAMALALELKLDGPLLHVVRGSGAGLTEYNRGLSYLVILAFPLMAGLMHGDFPLPRNRRWLAVAAFVLVLLVPAGLTESRASKLALVVGLAATFAALYLPKFTLRSLQALAVVCLAWPFGAHALFQARPDLLAKIPDSWHERVEIWDYLSYRISEKPWFGWGLGTTHLLPYENPDSASYLFKHEAAPHAHNVVTELWVELGVPGLLLGLAFALLCLHKASKLDQTLRPYAYGAWVAALCLSLVAYNFWTDSLFCAFALSGFLLAMLSVQQKQGV